MNNEHHMDKIVGFIEETAKEIEADFWVPQLPTEF